MSRTQNGCCTFQRLMERNDNFWRAIYGELEHQLFPLVTYHLCLCLLDYINPNKALEDLLKKIKKVIVVVSFCVHGTRVSEKVLEMIQTPTEMRTVEVKVNFNFLCLWNLFSFFISVQQLQDIKHISNLCELQITERTVKLIRWRYFLTGVDTQSLFFHKMNIVSSDHSRWLWFSKKKFHVTHASRILKKEEKYPNPRNSNI